jgi:hypothetical protein
MFVKIILYFALFLVACYLIYLFSRIMMRGFLDELNKTIKEYLPKHKDDASFKNN